MAKTRQAKNQALTKLAECQQVEKGGLQNSFHAKQVGRLRVAGKEQVSLPHPAQNARLLTTAGQGRGQETETAEEGAFAPLRLTHATLQISIPAWVPFPCRPFISCQEQS